MENKNNKQPPGKGIMAFTWILIAAITAVIAANDGDTSILSVAAVIITVALVILIDRAKTARRTKKTANASRPTVELHRPYPQPKAKQCHGQGEVHPAARQLSQSGPDRQKRVQDHEGALRAAGPPG